MTLDDFGIPPEHRNVEHILAVARAYKHIPAQTPSSFAPYQDAKKDTHLIYVALSGPWFYINGEKELRFKTRGNNDQDLTNALSRYDIDYWESDFEQVVRDMAAQLQAQVDAKNALIELEAIA
ncbi:hypothetical protein [Nitrososphaera sp.]|uniref:hypothetical protein n=1 Tax=Nitrososphaera sp. TaxID=1971748 RepID=UPI00307FA2A7